MTIFRTNTTVGLTIEPDNAGNIVFIANNVSVMRMEPSGTVDISSGRLVVPTGNTLTRPAIPNAGMLRFNTQTEKFEVYNGTAWADLTQQQLDIQYLAIGGGGAGGGGVVNYSIGSGGGAGGMLYGNLTLRYGSPITVTVGGGGAGAPTAVGSNGSNTSILYLANSILAVGGGRGDANGSSSSPNYARGGGSGGGTYKTSPFAGAGYGFPGIAGSTQQGFPGGAGGDQPYPYPTAGGGGASQAGAAGSGSVGGKGGDGAPSLITGSNVIYAGGGGGTIVVSGTGGAGGAGGGGAGGVPTGTSGTTNRGGGGGGGGGTVSTAGTGGSGGSGIIILAHANTISNAIVSAGITYTLNTISRPGFIVYEITAGTGSIYWSA